MIGRLAHALLFKMATYGRTSEGAIDRVNTGMKIITCINDSGGAAAATFEATIDGFAGKYIAARCRDAPSLESELRKPWASYDMVILFAGTTAELEQYLSLKELLEGIPVLLVLPESRGDICKRAHLLRPRFISFADSDFSDFAAVLQKMIIKRDTTPSPVTAISACLQK